MFPEVPYAGAVRQLVLLVFVTCRSFSRTRLVVFAAYAGGNNFLYDNYNAEMITKKSAQMYCQTGAPSFPVVEATIQSAHEVGYASCTAQIVRHACRPGRS